MFSNMTRIRIFDATECAHRAVSRIFHGTRGHARVELLMLLHMPLPPIASLYLFVAFRTPMNVARVFVLGDTFRKIRQGRGIAQRTPGSAKASIGTVCRWAK